ncbi:MAG: CoA transferase [Chloroflexi bacterium]|nr:CoA transferase [Chloroflexota bacterium]
MPDARKKPLAGIRVTDFTWAIAGPYATTMLSYFGAEVIKIESRRRLDITRTVVHPITKKFPDPDESPAHIDFNHNKYAVTLNIQHPAARDIAKRMAQVSDVVVENFRPGVLARLGLDYKVLATLRPDLIMLSTSTMGQTGPKSGIVGYAPLFAAESGLGEMTGYPDRPPGQVRLTVDAMSALSNTFTIMAALHYRASTGKGQYIDESSTEVVSALLGDSLLDYTANGRVQTRSVNRDENGAPHNCYRCAGQDRWISIVVHTDEEWKALRETMGEPAWAAEPRFATTAGRRAYEAELDKHIEAWTVQFDAYDLMHRLQEAGVAAVPSFSSEDLFTDPHLIERGLAHVLEQPKLGALIIQSPPWKLAATPPTIDRHAPLLGEHNPYVMKELLGMSDLDVKRLEEQGVFT